MRMLLVVVGFLFVGVANAYAQSATQSAYDEALACLTSAGLQRFEHQQRSNYNPNDPEYPHNAVINRWNPILTHAGAALGKSDAEIDSDLLQRARQAAQVGSGGSGAYRGTLNALGRDRHVTRCSVQTLPRF